MPGCLLLHSSESFKDILLMLFYLKNSGSLVRPKVVKSVHYCPATGGTLSREYRDITSFVGLPTGSVYPTRVHSFDHPFATLFNETYLFCL